MTGGVDGSCGVVSSGTPGDVVEPVKITLFRQDQVLETVSLLEDQLVLRVRQIIRPEMLVLSHGFEELRLLRAQRRHFLSRFRRRWYSDYGGAAEERRPYPTDELVLELRNRQNMAGARVAGHRAAGRRQQAKGG
jgi:hypothetical protein